MANSEDLLAIRAVDSDYGEILESRMGQPPMFEANPIWICHLSTHVRLIVVFLAKHWPFFASD
jgi:hypothetical protein